MTQCVRIAESGGKKVPGKNDAGQIFLIGQPLEIALNHVTAIFDSQNPLKKV